MAQLINNVLGRLWLMKVVVVGSIFTIGVVVLYRMRRPSVARVCDHIAELAPNPIVQPKIDRALSEVPAAAKQTSPAARCDAYFAALYDDPHNDEYYNERAGCVIDAKTRSSVAACLEK